jgi:two-component system sensor histidine kinase/response regulator
MSSVRAFSLRRILPSAVFDQLGSVMRQTVQAIAEAPLILTEAVLPANQRPLGQVERFIAVISSQFSGLLLAETPPGKAEPLQNQPIDEMLPAHDVLRWMVCQVGLTFDVNEIATFLTGLSRKLEDDPLAVSTLEQAIQQLKPNDPTVQSEFTLRLAEVLSVALSVALPPSEDGSCDLVVAAALQQQVEQERLLNEVTTQIRQSMNLPDILETTVKQVRQLLQAERVVIYEFHPSAIAALGEHSKWTDKAQYPRTAYGRITYESRALDSLPAALDMEEGMQCFPDVPNYFERYSKGFIQAIDDTEATFALSPCLLKLMRRVQARAKLVVPIIVQKELWGLLIAHQCAGPRHWQDHEKTFMKRIAEHLAIAINQSRLYTQLQQQKQMLEQRVVERTQELGDALIAAQAASRAKTEFLAAMSHELRTPLTCVIGMAETLLRAMSQKPDTYTLQPQKQQEYLRIIKRSGEHLLELINDILDVSQVEAGKTILNITHFSLSQLAHQSLQMLREKASSNGVDLVLDLRIESSPNHTSSEDDFFSADRRRIYQILLNLLSNAVKFTPAGGRVILRVWVENNYAIFQVEDTGIGIPASQHTLLFQKFQQLDSAYHRNYEGTGLGLALTKQLVELHGGTIEVESTVGVGSIFTVKLPAHPLPASVTEEAMQIQASAVVSRSKSADEAVTINHALLAGGRIILIEDHEETAMLVCDLLTAAGCQVIWMLDGLTAIKQIELLQPLLVITDIQLPGMDGYEVIQFLRHHPATKDIKILALTARALPEDQERCLAGGANAYLAKPVQPYQLLDQVSALVGAT